MKKVLSLTLAASLLGGAFAGVAGAATDLTVEQQFKALFDAGVFAGVDSKGTPGLDQEMTRAQMAVIIAKLKGLTQDAAGQSFADVKAGYWGAGWIGAATKANLFAGVGENKFNPEGTVTIEEIAVVVAKAFGLTESTAAVEGKVSDWAKGWVAAAVGANLLPKFSDYTTVADRGDLVAASYTVYEASQKVSVSSAKATGVYKVEVAVSRPVDKTKATLTLKKGTLTVATAAPVWSEDGKTATLNVTGSKISNGEYTVTLGGVVAETIGTASASFTAEDEKVAELKFVNEGDTLAYSKKATVMVKPLNQYGEVATLNGVGYTATAFNQTITPVKDDEGNLLISVDTTVDVLVSNASTIPVYVYVNDTRLTATKIFKLGTQPFLNKVEVDKVEYPDKKESLSAQGDSARVWFKLYDQFNNPVVEEQFGTDRTEIPFSTFNTFVQPYAPDLTVGALDFDSGRPGVAYVEVTLTKPVDQNTEYTLNLQAGSGTAKAAVKVGASVLAVKIAFGEVDGVVAAGDTDFYLPIIATDANGNTMTKQQIADNAINDSKRFTFSASNTDSVEIVKAGPHKGELKLVLEEDVRYRERVFVTGSLISGPINSFAQKEIVIQPQRLPERVIIKEQSATKAIIGATATVKFQIMDQYGKELNYTGAAVEDANGKDYVYRVFVTPKDTPVSGQLYSGLSTVAAAGEGYAAGEKVYTFSSVVDADKNNRGTHTLSAVVQRKEVGQLDSAYVNYSNKLDASVTVIEKTTPLTYSINEVGTLYATTADGNVAIDAHDDLDSLATNPFDKGISLTAKDASGVKVAVPSEIGITNIASSNTDVVAVTYGATNAALGQKDGVANISVSLKNEFRSEAAVVNQEITVKKDTPAAASFKEVDGTYYYGSVTTFNAYDAMGKFIVVDQYGNEFNEANLGIYADVFKIRYAISNKVGNGTVTINQTTGAITVTGGTASFTLTATTINGKTASTEVSN